MSNLAFFAADCLGTTLYQLDGKLEASEVRKIMLGAWKIDLSVDVKSDIINGKELTFWATLAKQLQVYVIVREDHCWLLVLDTKELRKCGKKTGFAAETVRERVLEFKPAIRATFQWEKDRWGRVLSDCDNSLGGR